MPYSIGLSPEIVPARGKHKAPRRQHGLWHLVRERRIRSRTRTEECDSRMYMAVVRLVQRPVRSVLQQSRCEDSVSLEDSHADTAFWSALM
jgi:hypothetical protein